MQTVSIEMSLGEAIAGQQQLVHAIRVDALVVSVAVSLCLLVANQHSGTRAQRIYLNFNRLLALTSPTY